MQTPCPSCQQPLTIAGDGTTCSCGQGVRFVEVPEAPCFHCGVPVRADTASVCPACGRLQHPERPIRTVARCPRCRRRFDVAATDATMTCRRCGQESLLRDTL